MRLRATIGFADLANAINGGAMTLWDLLTSVCFFIPIAGALASAKLAKVGFGGHVMAIAIGLALGLLCAWTMRVVAKAIVAKLQRHPNWEHAASLQEWFFRGLYFAALVWIVFAGFLGGRVSLAVLRFAY